MNGGRTENVTNCLFFSLSFESFLPVVFNKLTKAFENSYKQAAAEPLARGTDKFEFHLVIRKTGKQRLKLSALITVEV